MLPQFRWPDTERVRALEENTVSALKQSPSPTFRRVEQLGVPPAYGVASLEETPDGIGIDLPHQAAYVLALASQRPVFTDVPGFFDRFPESRRQFKLQQLIR